MEAPSLNNNGTNKLFTALSSANEVYGSDISLSYPGKQPEEEILSAPAVSLQHLWGTTNTNRLYYGDNIKVLASLLQDTTVRGKVRTIYIDPPYSTGRTFESRTRNSAYADTLQGASYLEFIRARLILLRELLAEDGSIYVHLDENMAFYTKVVMDEVFGRSNYRNWITRRKCNPKNYTRKTYGNVSDYILFYTKSNQYIWNRAVEQWTHAQAIKEYPYIEKATGRRYKKVPIHAPGLRNGETGKQWRNMFPPKGKHWQFTPQTLEEMDKRGEIYWSPTGNPRRKIYLDESKGIPVQDIWLNFKDAHNQNIKITGYPTEKNPDLISRIIEASSNPGDLILDCFSGSGTTLSVASSLSRQWIGIDNSFEAITTTLKRFCNGVEIMGVFNTSSVSQQQQPELFSEKGPVPEKELFSDKIVNFSLYGTEHQDDEIAQLRTFIEQLF